MEGKMEDATERDRVAEGSRELTIDDLYKWEK